jgi:hypothetical protein
LLFRREESFKLLEKWSVENIQADEQGRFLEVAEDEILALHEGNFARYKLLPSEFDAWRKVWG